ncbi:hypothetical protein [Streptomyces sp. NPDC054887]
MRESHPVRPSRSLLVVGAALLTATLAASLGSAPDSSGDDGRAAKSASAPAQED